MIRLIDPGHGLDKIVHHPKSYKFLFTPMTNLQKIQNWIDKNAIDPCLWDAQECYNEAQLHHDSCTSSETSTYEYEIARGYQTKSGRTETITLDCEIDPEFTDCFRLSA